MFFGWIKLRGELKQNHFLLPLSQRISFPSGPFASGLLPDLKLEARVMLAWLCEVVVGLANGLYQDDEWVPLLAACT